MKLNIREAAAMLNVSESKLYRWVDDGEIPCVTIQDHPLFHRLELLEWAMEQNIPISVDLYEDATDAPFTTALERGGGQLMMTGSELAQLARNLPIEPGDREVIGAVLAARGREMFQTRDGIAIPSPRSPLICSDVLPTVALWWSREEPILIDEVPAKAIFAIITPTVLDHLQLLSRLSLVLRDEAFAAAVKRVDPFASLLVEARRAEQALESKRVRSPRR